MNQSESERLQSELEPLELVTHEKPGFELLAKEIQRAIWESSEDFSDQPDHPLIRAKRLCEKLKSVPQQELSLTVTHEEFQVIYARVCDRLKDLMHWRTEMVAKITVEETLAAIAEKFGE